MLASAILAGCSGGAPDNDPAAFERQAQTVQKTYGMALSRLVACMIDADVHEPHPRFSVSPKTADFDLRGVFRMHLEAHASDETVATITGLPGGEEPHRLSHYVEVLDHCGGGGPAPPAGPRR